MEAEAYRSKDGSLSYQVDVSTLASDYYYVKLMQNMINFLKE